MSTLQVKSAQYKSVARVSRRLDTQFKNKEIEDNNDLEAVGFISIASMYSNYTGDGLVSSYKKSASAYNLLSVSNQPQLQIFYSCFGGYSSRDKKKREYYIVIPDIVYSLVFIIWIYYWKKTSKQIKHESNKIKVTPSYYGVYVSNLPRNFTDEMKLAQHFSQFGTVVEAKIVRDYNGSMSDYRDLVRIKYKMVFEQEKIKNHRSKLSAKKVENIEKKIKKLQKKYKDTQHIIESKNNNGIQSSYDQFPALGAYIVFNERVNKMYCLQVFQRANRICADKPAITFLNKKFLKIKGNIDEPSNIKWENLDAKTCEIFGRRSFVAFLMVLVMILTIAVIFAANIVKPTNSNNCPQNEITFDEAKKQQNQQYIVDCFCRQISPQKLYEDADLKEFCWDSYIKYLYMILMSVVFALVVVFVNFILRILLKKLGRFSKYPTITSETLGTTINLFIAMFINTAIITLLFSADIYSFKPSVIIASPIPPLKDIQSDNSKDFNVDFDRSWYIEVGAQIIYAMVFNIFSPHLLSLLSLPCIRRQRAKKAKKAIVQRDMNENMLGPEYSITAQYAIVLNTIFVTLFYSGGMPLLLWIGFFSLFCQYWVYKYMLLRYNKRPPAYDHKLNKRIIQILPYAIIFHLMISLYMYSSPLLFPKSADAVIEKITSQLTSSESQNDLFSSKGEKISVLERAKSQLYILILLGLVIVKFIVERTIGKFFLSLKKCCCGKKNNRVVPKDKFLPYEDEYEEMNKRQIASYEIKLNPKYADLVKALESGSMQNIYDPETQASARYTEQVSAKSHFIN